MKLQVRSLSNFLDAALPVRTGCLVAFFFVLLSTEWTYQDALAIVSVTTYFRLLVN